MKLRDFINNNDLTVELISSSDIDGTEYFTCILDWEDNRLYCNGEEISGRGKSERESVESLVAFLPGKLIDTPGSECEPIRVPNDLVI